jgi:DNA-directed RNA polymerase specialized sigma24 family protein
MGAPAAPPETRLLSWLTGTDRARQNEAFTELLREHGVGFGPDDRGRPAMPAGGKVNAQPASVIQEAVTDLWEDLAEIAPKCRSDQEIKNVFAAIVKRRYIDRLRRKANKGGVLGPEHDVGGTRGPGTVTSRIDDTHLYKRHIDRLLDAAADGGNGGGDADTEDDAAIVRRRLVEMYIIRQMEWPEIAQELGASVGAIKVRFTRLRPCLVEAVYEEFLAALPPTAGPLARMLLVDGRRTADAAKQIGVTEQEARTILSSSILPRMREHFGRSFLELVPRLQRRASGEKAE